MSENNPGTGRLEALSDGVIAVILTILVLTSVEIGMSASGFRTALRNGFELEWMTKDWCEACLE